MVKRTAAIKTPVKPTVKKSPLMNKLIVDNPPAKKSTANKRTANYVSTFDSDRPLKWPRTEVEELEHQTIDHLKEKLNPNESEVRFLSLNKILIEFVVRLKTSFNVGLYRIGKLPCHMECEGGVWFSHCLNIKKLVDQWHLIKLFRLRTIECDEKEVLDNSAF